MPPPEEPPEAGQVFTPYVDRSSKITDHREEWVSPSPGGPSGLAEGTCAVLPHWIVDHRREPRTGDRRTARCRDRPPAVDVRYDGVARLLLPHPALGEHGRGPSQAVGQAREDARRPPPDLAGGSSRDGCSRPRSAGRWRQCENQVANGRRQDSRHLQEVPLAAGHRRVDQRKPVTQEEQRQRGEAPFDSDQR